MDEFDKFLGAENGAEKPEYNEAEHLNTDVLSEAQVKSVLFSAQMILEKPLAMGFNQFVITVTRTTPDGPNIWSSSMGGFNISVPSLQELVEALNAILA